MLPFLAWGDFYACSHFARSTIPEEKWGITCSLAEYRLSQLQACSFPLPGNCRAFVSFLGKDANAPRCGSRQFIQKLPGVACVADRILVPGVLFWWWSHHVRQAEKLQGIDFLEWLSVRENLACQYISYEFWMSHTFFTWFGTMW